MREAYDLLLKLHPLRCAAGAIGQLFGPRVGLAVHREIEGILGIFGTMDVARVLCTSSMPRTTRGQGKEIYQKPRGIDRCRS